ncbi:BglII/BstYI family type II restriction endonuclease [Deinococcus sp.]|uniref:BglII/BstYI family type II restriction endonuclease n=1 Tax=Deinococcus sp. TaxID=47478 RepID=UPI0025EF8046|nr:BglII/BstYI family type II restriction endonuclease [Deinococcus sp.]
MLKTAWLSTWNGTAKDQTFDRDLYAMSAFAQTGVISAGVLLTRSAELTPIFAQLGNDDRGKPIRSKYGASTTWMGKLLYRLEAGRNGSCPILAIGIRPAVIVDLGSYLADLAEVDHD